MAEVHFVKSARKNNPDAGIKKGDSYYWWKFRFGEKHCSKTRPRQSQLTQSDFLGTIYGLQESIEDILLVEATVQDDAIDELRSAADEIRNLGVEQEDKIGNMPESLQESETAELLRSRGEACETLADELEMAADDIEALDGDDSRVEAVQDILDEINWDCDV